MERAPLDWPAEPLARARPRRHPAARGLRPARENPLHDPAQGAAAVLRAVRQSRRQHPGELQALPHQRAAGDVQPVRRADQALDARGEQEPVRAEGQPGGGAFLPLARAKPSAAQKFASSRAHGTPTSKRAATSLLNRRTSLFSTAPANGPSISRQTKPSMRKITPPSSK